MSDEQVIRYCAPTLACIKTGSMFNGTFTSREDMIAFLRSLNCRLCSKGLRVLPLRYRQGHGLIYIYRPEQLVRDLHDAMAQSILDECGYDRLFPDRCLVQLIHRVRQSSDFPHEIGLFLGYPPCDVHGFIHHHEACLLAGPWKVYGNAASARQRFDRLNRCTSIYMQQYHRGVSLEKLTVPTHHGKPE